MNAISHISRRDVLDMTREQFEQWANHKDNRYRPTLADMDCYALAKARHLPMVMGARQYFDSTLIDSIIVESSVTPTTTKTSIFTPYTLANIAWPMGYGLSAPFAGQVFEFSCGGVITTPATGTLILDPYWGPGTSTTVFGTDLGASPAQTVTASLSSIQWELSGKVAMRTISSAATSSTAWCSGSFRSQGTLATAGAGWTIPFGSTAAVSVDTTGTGSAGTFGALMVAVTFSVTGGTIKTEWTNMRSLN